MTTSTCFDVRFNKSKNYVLTTFKGSLNSEGILASFDYVVNSVDYQAGMGRIWDLTAADLSGLNDEAIWMIAGYSSIFPAGINNVKVALISEQATYLELIKLFKTYSKEGKTKVEYFDSFKAAEEWITGDQA